MTNPTNARKHSAKQLKQIAVSIKRFGFLVPIIIDDADMIAAGHGRLEAAARLGFEMVPVIRAQLVGPNDRLESFDDPPAHT